MSVYTPSVKRAVLVDEAEFLTGAGVAASIAARARQLPTMQRFTALWKGGLGADPADWLVDHGWTTRAYDMNELAAGYHRHAPPHAEAHLVTASR